jgi:hypothetical protein
VPFILPVLVDDTREPDALVPDRFRTVQWTKLRGGEVPPEVQQRFLKLWSHRTGVLKNQSATASAANDSAPLPPSTPNPAEPLSRPSWFFAVAAALVFVAAGVWLINRRTSPTNVTPIPAPATAVSTKPSAVPTAAPLSEARQIAQRAQALIESLEGVRDDYQLAEELIAQAKAKDATDAEVCALQALPRDWLNWYRGPKGLLIGDAHQVAGRADAATIEWQATLKLVDQRLVDQPKDSQLLGMRVLLLARLGQRDQATRQFSVFL